MSETSELMAAAKLFNESEQGSEHVTATREPEQEGQDALAKQEATPETTEAKQETSTEAKAEGDTEAKPQLFKVTDNGEELEVDEVELKKGYTRTRNYERNQKQLAEERKAISAQKEQLDAQIQDAQLLIDDELSKLESPEMQALREENPEKYLAEEDRIKKRAKKFNDLKESRKAELANKETARIKKERELLIEAFPEWSDETLMQKEVGELFQVMSDMGFSDEELSGVTDHRMFVLASKAKKLADLENISLENKETKTTPKTAKPNAKQEQSDTKKVDLNAISGARSLRQAARLF